MSRLTTHILDTSCGRPASGVRIELGRIEDGRWQKLAGAVTNADGRTDQPLLSGSDFRAGLYEIHFHVGAYFEAASAAQSPFLEVVPVRFRISDTRAHYHVPLLVTPWSYATYRGS